MRQVKFEGEKGHDAPLTGYLALRAREFVHPREVVSDKELHPFEKRAILAAWASDISAVDSRPQFRWLSGTPGPVALPQILAALQQLDGQTEAQSAVLSTMSQARSGPRANGGAG